MPNLDRAQKFISSILSQDRGELIDPLDFASVRRKLYARSLDAVRSRFPLHNEQHVLDADNLAYADPEEFSLEDQKKAMMSGRSVARRLRGS